MIKAHYSNKWTEIVVPRLPHRYYLEYIDMLAAFVSEYEVSADFPTCNTATELWSFPFTMPLAEGKTFDFDEFEKWQEMVEADMCQRYGWNVFVFGC
jgi:hypothetical protein